MDNIFSEKIINWYLQNKRDLPWRNTSDPYQIWISEIILQQTRVNQGLDYYYKFIERFPTVDALAKAEEDEVLKYWQGLGYYSRARNLHKASKKILTEYNGIFPSSYKDILNLSGVGDYTASAIASFAFGLPYATVDGNVYRVFSRLFGIKTPIDSSKAKKEFFSLAQELLSIEEPALHNQAMMEFGALYCTPSSPDCPNCILKEHCKAYETNSVNQLPLKSQKTKSTNRFFNYLFIQFGDCVYLKQRTGNDVWKNLYEFPLIESEKVFEIEELLSNEEFKEIFTHIDKVEIHSASKTIKHVLSHRNIFARFFTVSIKEENEFIRQNFIRTSRSELDKYAVSRLIELFLETME